MLTWAHELNLVRSLAIQPRPYVGVGGAGRYPCSLLGDPMFKVGDVVRAAVNITLPTFEVPMHTLGKVTHVYESVSLEVQFEIPDRGTVAVYRYEVELPLAIIGQDKYVWESQV